MIGPANCHEARPQQPELERQHRARHRADGEQNRAALRPALGELEIDVVARAPPPPLGQHHQQRHRDADLGEHDVEAERQRHLRAGGEQVGHGVVINRDPAAVRSPRVDTIVTLRTCALHSTTRSDARRFRRRLRPRSRLSARRRHRGHERRRRVPLLRRDEHGQPRPGQRRRAGLRRGLPGLLPALARLRTLSRRRHRDVTRDGTRRVRDLHVRHHRHSPHHRDLRQRPGEPRLLYRAARHAPREEERQSGRPGHVSSLLRRRGRPSGHGPHVLPVPQFAARATRAWTRRRDRARDSRRESRLLARRASTQHGAKVTGDETRRGERAITLVDPHGQHLALVETSDERLLPRVGQESGSRRPADRRTARRARVGARARADRRVPHRRARLHRLRRGRRLASLRRRRRRIGQAHRAPRDAERSARRVGRRHDASRRVARRRRRGRACAFASASRRRIGVRPR